MSKDVERLSADLADALQDFVLVAALDTNARVEENSRSVGGLRRLHDFEVEKLGHISATASEDGSYMSVLHAARVEGSSRLFVVRYSDLNRGHTSTATPPRRLDCNLRRREADYEKILEKPS
ncbi:hypothetical protein AURDEDRAFT_164130 [Auricularia subglabra TFB-10046 SS5]|nr:hypothetical protein AURDEDRAFT_164130 [Auricularia subglabra TFB-10046 SS5]